MASLPPRGQISPDDVENEVPMIERFEDYDPSKRRSHADVVKKDIHLFKKLQTHQKPLNLKPITIDHFEIRSARPLQQPHIEKKDCYYKQTEQDCKIDIPTSVTVLHDDCDTFHKKFIEDCLKNNDNNMTTTRKDLLLKQGLLFIDSLNIDEEQEKVINFFHEDLV